MNDSQPKRGARRRSSRLQGWMFALLGSFLLAVPTIRTSELSEVTSANERVENIAFASRPESLRRTSQNGRREAIVFTSSIQARLGREQRNESLAPLNGHRLPNGLLAPMTC
jgi:hypothetical protein